jgi:2-desacetyl-2-hydroxyethyl bacteriochlorophyllide A dehydrogenase
MKGVMFTQKGKAEILDETKPKCNQDTILCKTLYSGISNGTERNLLIGGNYSGGTWPNRIGYQLVGEVIQTGQKIKSFQKGDILFSAGFHGHVEYFTVKENDLIIKLPSGKDIREAALLGVAGVPWNNLRRAGTTADDSVVIIGSGLIGICGAQLAQILGAKTSLAAGAAGHRLEAAEKVGIKSIFNNKTEQGQTALKKAGPYSVVLECSGANVLDQITGIGFQGEGIVAEGARVYLTAGRFRADIDFNAASKYKLSIMFSTHFNKQDLEQIVQFWLDDKLIMKPLLSQTVPIKEAPGIYQILADNPSALLGTVFAW